MRLPATGGDSSASSPARLPNWTPRTCRAVWSGPARGAPVNAAPARRSPFWAGCAAWSTALERRRLLWRPSCSMARRRLPWSGWGGGGFLASNREGLSRPQAGSPSETAARFSTTLTTSCSGVHESVLARAPALRAAHSDLAGADGRCRGSGVLGHACSGLRRGKSASRLASGDLGFLGGRGRGRGVAADPPGATSAGRLRDPRGSCVCLHRLPHWGSTGFFPLRHLVQPGGGTGAGVVGGGTPSVGRRAVVSAQRLKLRLANRPPRPVRLRRGDRGLGGVLAGPFRGSALPVQRARDRLARGGPAGDGLAADSGGRIGDHLGDPACRPGHGGDQLAVRPSKRWRAVLRTAWRTSRTTVVTSVPRRGEWIFCRGATDGNFAARVGADMMTGLTRHHVNNQTPPR